MGWGSVARDNVQVEGVELIRCVNGCVASPTRENGSGSRTEKGAIRAGNVDLLCIAVSP